MAGAALTAMQALPALNTCQTSRIKSPRLQAESCPLFASLRQPSRRAGPPSRLLSTSVRKSLHVCASSDGSKGTGKKAPGWAEPGSDEPPPWARNEKATAGDVPSEIPFPVYLVGSALVAIAAVGSIFEIVNKNPIFGVVNPDSPLWLPILGFFAVTGFPSAAYLFYKAITGANKASESADREDGFL